jgi:hypothetical protein
MDTKNGPDPALVATIAIAVAPRNWTTHGGRVGGAGSITVERAVIDVVTASDGRAPSLRAVRRCLPPIREQRDDGSFPVRSRLVHALVSAAWATARAQGRAA